jgi:SWI/SNF-related matrix-associated actin-dependent regulator 1 of chromatin subfamily A
VCPDSGAKLAGYAYQVKGAAWLAPRCTALLADDMGLGKTPQALLAIDPSKGTIIVVPASVKLNWARECRRWRPDLRPEVLSGRGSWRWPSAGEVVITNPDILPAFLLPKLETRTASGYKLKVANLDKQAQSAAANCIVIADEAHMYKKHKTQRSQKMRELCRACACAWALTGTPLENRPFDLWGVLNTFGMAGEVFGGWRTFLRLFDGYKNRWGGYEFGSPAQEVPERMRRVMLRRLKSEVLTELPAKTYAELRIEIRSKRLQKSLDRQYDAWGDLLKAGELPGFEEFSRIRSDLAADRIPAMLEIVESHEESGQPLLVFSYHRAPVEALKDREGWAIITGDTSNIQRDRIVSDFQAGRLRGVGLTIRAAGVGLTLTRASHSLFVDLDWVPTWNIQAEDRIHRIGQTSDKVLITRMVSDHPLDLHVQKLLQQKMNLIHGAIEREVSALQLPTVREVSAEEHAAKLERLARAEAEAEAAAEAGRTRRTRAAVSGWLASARRQAKRPEAEITPELRPVLSDALGYMLERCDGAVAKDGAGFNRPDAAIVGLLLRAGLESDEEYRLAERILCRYRRQLGREFPALWR